MTKVKVKFLLGVLLLSASNPVLAETEGEKLFQQISSDITQYETANHLPDLMTRIRGTIQSSEVRSIQYHAYTITRNPDLFYSVSGLKRGQHPYHTTGDWDCDGETDQAVLLQKPKEQVVVVLSSGMTLTFEADVDGITSGEPGRHLPAAGKRYGDGEGEKVFTAKCGFINASHWGKSSFALVVDLEARKLLQYWTSD